MFLHGAQHPQAVRIMLLYCHGIVEHEETWPCLVLNSQRSLKMRLQAPSLCILIEGKGREMLNLYF